MRMTEVYSRPVTATSPPLALAPLPFSNSVTGHALAPIICGCRMRYLACFVSRLFPFSITLSLPSFSSLSHQHHENIKVTGRHHNLCKLRDVTLLVSFKTVSHLVIKSFDRAALLLNEPRQ